MSEVAHTPQLRFPEFHDNWNPTIFGKYVEKHKGGASLKPKDFVKKSTCEVIPKKAIQSGGLLALDEDNPTYCSEVFFGDNLRNVVDSSYLITTLRDLVPSGPSIGYIVRNHISNPLILAQGVYGFILKSGIDKEFLIQLSNRVDYRRLMQKIMVGSTQVHIRTQDFFGISLNLPTLSEQQKIAAFLTAVDNKIKQLSKKKALLGEYKKGLMQQIFSQEIRFKADDGSEFPDWEEKKLGDVLKRTSTGLNPRQNFKLGYGENYYVTIKNISNGKLDFSKCERIDNDAMAMIANRSDLSKDDLIMSSIGNVGESYLLDKEPVNWNINESVFMLRASELMLPQFLYFIITNEQSKWYLESNSTGSSFKSIKLGELKLLPLELPLIEEQTKIANFLSSIDSKIEQVVKQLDESKQFKKALLQQMFV